MIPPTRTYDPRAVRAWALYDFANSSFTTLVVTFIYGTFFTKVMAADEPTGTALWSLGVTITAVAVAVLSPLVGALADQGAGRRRLLATCTGICILGTVGLFFPQPGQGTIALVLFVVANVAFELGYVFYNAYLPDIAPPDRIGRISGYGWALGYAGGLLCLAVALVGLVGLGGEPLIPLPETNGLNIRATNLLVAGWFFVFSLPALLILRDSAPPRPGPVGDVFRNATRELVRTFQHVRRYRNVFRYLVAHLVYNDGLVTVFAMGGIYAASVFGLSFQEILIFGIVLNVAAGLGAFLFGFLDDRLGGKTTILVSLAGLFVFALMAVLVRDVSLFWVAGVGIGLLVGPNQSASRSLMGRLVPADRENEFFGFYQLSGKAMSFLGPALFGALTLAFRNHRAGMAVLLAFFLIGALLLLRVDVGEGMREAGRIPAVDAHP